MHGDLLYGKIWGFSHSAAHSGREQLKPTSSWVFR